MNITPTRPTEKNGEKSGEKSGEKLCRGCGLTVPVAADGCVGCGGSVFTNEILRVYPSVLDPGAGAGPRRTCLGHELEVLTKACWRLSSPHALTEEVQELGLSYSTQGPPVVVSRPVFVLEKSRDEETERLRTELVAANERSSVLGKEIDVATLELKRVATSETALRGALDRQKEVELACLGRESDLRKAVHRLEEDLGKVRKEIGDGRLREILGERSGSP